MNATAYEIRREATSGSPTNLYDAPACGGINDAVVSWNNECAMAWLVTQEMKVIRIRNSMRWRRIKITQDGFHVKERMNTCHKPMCTLRNQHELQMLLRCSRRHQFDIDVVCR